MTYLLLLVSPAEILPNAVLSALPSAFTHHRQSLLERMIDLCMLVAGGTCCCKLGAGSVGFLTAPWDFHCARAEERNVGGVVPSRAWGHCWRDMSFLTHATL